MKRFGRPSPAMIVSCVAVVLALGGTAFAGGALTAKKVKNLANGEITKRAPSLDVNSAKTAASATAATTATTATTAGSAGNVFGAVVTDGGVGSIATLARSTVPGTTVADDNATEGVAVTFPGKNLAGCAYTATSGNPGNASSSGYSNVALVGNSVLVKERQQSGALAELNFHVIVVCP